jgi:hypothetical protein
MAAAASLGFVDSGDQAHARAAAMEVALVNPVWGEPADVTPGDVTFGCPSNSLSGGSGLCTRVDVFRNQARGNPLPTLFASMVGVTAQGVRATATAETLFSNTASCVKPMAVLDRWVEAGSGPWDPDDTFDRYAPLPAALGTLVPNPDSYVPATPGANGSGFDLSDPDAGYGRQLRLARRLTGHPDAANWYFPVQLDCPGNVPGSIECFTWNILNCSPQVVAPGAVIQAHGGGFVDINGVNQLAVALDSLRASDALASWDPGANGGRGGIAGGCMASGDCAVSPRLIALPVIDPDAWGYQTAASHPGDVHPTVNVTRVVGLFIDTVNFTEIVGYLMPYPSAPSATADVGVAGQAFVVSTLLVR